MAMQLLRHLQNPIISPSNFWWEKGATFNPGATVFQDYIVLLYRAFGADNLSRFGLATSKDGIIFQRYQEPILESNPDNPYERLGIEDPRITLISDTYYIVYTAASVYPAETYLKGNFAPSVSHPAPWRVRPSLVTTKNFRQFESQGLLLDTDSKDAALFPEKIGGKFVLLHRIYPNVYLTFSSDLVEWEKDQLLLTPRPGFWDSERVGGGTVPIKTDKGWLIFYHGVDQSHNYQAGLLLLDLTNPAKVIYRSDEPVLKPTLPYERSGMTPNVVFPCGAVEKGEEIFVYYGGADKVVGLATFAKKRIAELNL